MADINVVMDKLQGFETADDLAEFFRGYGIVAQPRNANQCPISKFVIEETGLEAVTTTTVDVKIYENWDATAPEAKFLHTTAMAAFVSRFDRGAYEDLVEEGFETAVIDSNISIRCFCAECVKK